MKRKQIVLIVLLISCWVGSSAQYSFENIIYLKNGSIIRGKIAHQTEDSTRVETRCKDVFIFPTSDILEMKLEGEKIKIEHPNIDFITNKKGIYNHTTFGVLTGNSELTEDFSYSASTTFGYEFNHLLGIGVGTGVNKLKTELLPVFVSLKSNLLNRAFSPIATLKVGYSFPISKTKNIDETEYNYEGGLVCGFDLGVCNFGSKNHAFTITLGYQYQILQEKSSFPDWYWYQETYYKNTYEFNKITIKIGFLFK